QGERRSLLESLAPVTETLVFYEAPHRITDMLHDLGKIFGPNRRLVIARELTKVHEEFVRGVVSEVLVELVRREIAKGEITVIVAGKSENEETSSSKQNLLERIAELMSSGNLDEKDALKQAAREFGLSKSDAYREWQRRRQGTGNRGQGVGKLRS